MLRWAAVPLILIAVLGLATCDLQSSGTLAAVPSDGSPSDVTVDAPFVEDGGLADADSGAPDANEAGPAPGGIALGLRAWYRSDTIVVTDGGDGGPTVAQWPDISGSGDPKRVAAGAGVTAPAVALDAGYGTPVVHFALGTYLQTQNWTGPLTPPLTIFVVGDGRGYFVDSLTTASPVAILAFNGATEVRLYAGNYVSGGGAPTGKRALIGIFDGTSSEIHNSSNPPTAIGNAGTNQLAGMTIGGYSGLVAGFSLDGNLAEVAVWNRRLTLGEIASLNAYAASRYGLTITP